jgi:FAD/FMN-containing dehydrogenase
MVWPVLPIVAEGLVPHALALTGAHGVWQGIQGNWIRAVLSPLLTLPAVGLVCRLVRAALGPQTKPGGACSREDHLARVQQVSDVAKNNPGPLRMFKATTSNTFRPQQIGARESSKKRLNLSTFVHVLEVNTEELWCDIEASATFETFVDATLPLGVAPLVVPELRTITVGGAIVGIGIESSSFKHGFFHEGLMEADILLASGDVVRVGPEGEYAELFRAIPNSLGSFGYLLRLRMRVQRATPYVRLEKAWFSNPEGLVGGVETACGTEADYVDAVAIGDHGGMVMQASFVPEVPKGQRVKLYGLWPQFYPTIVHEGVEYLRTQDYLWRWDADWFWVTQIFPGLTWRLVRWLCGPHMLRSDVYKAFNDWVIKNVLDPWKLNKNEELVIQDIEIPLDRSADYIRKFWAAVPSTRIGKIKLTRPGLPRQAAPIWLCPVKGTSSPLMPMEPSKLYINFGFWDALEGPETVGGMVTGTINKALEQVTAELHGKKTLYGVIYFTEEQFLKEYNGGEYKRIKQRYDPDGRLRGWYERLAHA